MQDNMNQPQWKIVLKKMWPYINRGVNTTVYFTLNIIKNGVKSAFNQLKGGGAA